MNDKQGRVYAKLSQLKPGDIVWVDDGFTCVKAWSRKVIKKDHLGGLYFDCSRGGHFLYPQVANDFLIGVYPKNPKE